MKTIQQIIDNASIRLMSSMTRNEITELIIEASKQAFEAGIIHGVDYNQAQYWGDHIVTTGWDKYLQEINP